MIKQGFIQECKVGLTFGKFHHIKRVNEKCHMIISVYAEKAFDNNHS